MKYYSSAWSSPQWASHHLNTAPQQSVVLRVRRRWQSAEGVSCPRRSPQGGRRAIESGRCNAQFLNTSYFRPSARDWFVHSHRGVPNLLRRLLVDIDTPRDAADRRGVQNATIEVEMAVLPTRYRDLNSLGLLQTWRSVALEVKATSDNVWEWPMRSSLLFLVDGINVPIHSDVVEFGAVEITKTARIETPTFLVAEHIVLKPDFAGKLALYALVNGAPAVKSLNCKLTPSCSSTISFADSFFADVAALAIQ
jgi:hypothetical protein